MADRQEEPTIDGVTQREFNIWKHHPITQLYARYLRDMVKDGEAAAIDAWKGGKLELSSEHELRGRVLALTLASQPSFEAVYQFYRELEMMKQENEQNEDADQAEELFADVG